MEAKIIEWIIFAPLIVGLSLVSWWAMTESHRRLNDPDDDRTLYLDQLPGKMALAGFGIFRVTIYRQSGNVHAEKIISGSAHDALATALSTFRRAKIDAVHIGTNSETEFKIGRLYHDHRGRNEGKKVGKAHITLLERAGVSAPSVLIPAVMSPSGEPSITVQPIGLTCDCGMNVEIAFNQIRESRYCASCGKDVTLSSAQIIQLEAAVDEARVEALARYRAGETDIAVERRSKLAEDIIPVDEQTAS